MASCKALRRFHSHGLPQLWASSGDSSQPFHFGYHEPLHVFSAAVVGAIIFAVLMAALISNVYGRVGGLPQSGVHNQFEGTPGKRRLALLRSASAAPQLKRLGLISMLRNLTSLFLVSILFQISGSLASNDLSAEDRLKSCDPRVALAAAEEIVNKPDTLKEPLQLFSPAAVLFQHGKKDEAVFWFYAAQLRVRYQLAFENGDRGQLLSVMVMTVGPRINNHAFQDVANLNRILDRVLEWDKKTPNPYREKTKPENIQKQIDQVYAGLRDLKAKLSAERADLERKARLAAPEIERTYARGGNLLCRKDQLDPAYAAQATQKEWSLVTDFVKNNKDVIRQAGNIKET